MLQNSLEFSKNLLKGKIAENIFEQMFGDAGNFTVLSFGYENTLPELAHQRDRINVKETMDIIRRAPDFAVINHKTHDVYLVEVKYMRHSDQVKIVKAAQRMVDSWKPSYLFLAAPQGFFFGKASEILDNQGIINKLDNEWVSVDLQEKYLDLLNKFVQINLETSED
jgi:hypothetical protein